MMAVLAKDCPLKNKADVVRLVTDSGFRVHVSELAGVGHAICAAIGRRAGRRSAGRCATSGLQS